MKFVIYPITSILILLFTSCNNNSLSLGTVEFYPNFLWVKADTIPVTKTFIFEFSQDAKNDNKSFAEFQFVDNSGNPIKTNIMQVYDNGKLLSKNKLFISNDIEEKELTFMFTPKAKSGKHQGYLKLIRHNLDRLNSEHLNSGDKVDAFQWTLYYNKKINPLAKSLIWILIVIAICFFVWFSLLRPILYPHFCKFRKSILITKDNQIIGQFNYIFTGAYKVVFYDKKINQSLWQRIFIGEIKTYVNPMFKTKLTFSPRRKGGIALGTGYTTNPNPFLKNGVITISNNQEKITIILR